MKPRKFFNLIAIPLLSVSFTLVHAQWIVEGTGSGINSAKVSALDANGNIYVAGNYLLSDAIFAPDTLSNTGSFDGFLVKYDSSGALLWSKSFPTNGNYIFPYAIDIDGKGDVVLSAQYQNEVEIEGNTLNTSVTGFSTFIAKFNSAGTYQWSTQPTLINNGYIVNYGMDTDSAGYVYSAGLLEDSIQFSNDTLFSTTKGLFLTKHDNNGNYLKSIVNDTVYSQFSGLTYDKIGNYIYCAGTYQGTLALGLDTLFGLPTTTQSFVTKLDTTLTPLWLVGYEADSVLTINHQDSLLVISGRSVNTATIGTDVLTGTPGTSFDYITIMDTSGNFVWSKQIVTNSPTTNINRSEATFDDQGNVYATGAFGQPNTGNIGINVEAESATSVDDYDIYIIKFDPTGNVVWLQTVGDSGQDLSETITIIDSANIFIAGQYSDSIYFTNVIETNIDGGRDAFIAKIDICPQVQARFSISGNTTLCNGESSTLIAETSPTYQYQWQKDSVDIVGANTSTFSATDSAEYRLIITDNTYGCVKTSYPQFIIVNPLPDTTISLTDTLICDDEFSTISVPYNPTNGYNWFEDGVFIQDTVSNYTTMISGTYFVEVTNVYGCTDSTSEVTVTVMSYPDANITAGGTTLFCAGDSVELQTVNTVGLTYQWYLDEVALTNDTTHRIQAKTAGDYTVLVSNIASCDSLSDPVNVVTITSPTAQIDSTDNLTMCDGESVTLVSSTALGQTYQWQLNGTDIPSETSSTIDVSSSGSYNVVITNSNNCSTTSNILTTTVNPNPTASIAASGSTTICSTDSAQLDATTGTGLSYIWKRNGNSISGADQSTYYAKTTGFYSVVVSNAFNCSDESSTITIVVNQAPNATVSTNGGTDLCTGDSVELAANLGSGLSYQWLFNGSDISGETSSKLQAKAEGDYSVEVTNSANCTSTSNAQTINIISDPAANITAGSATTFCGGESVTLNANTGSGFTYKWFKNGFEQSVTDSSIVVATTGDYSVEVTINGSCSATSSVISTNVLSNPTPIITQNNVTLSTANFTQYQWYLNGSIINGATAQLYLATESGSYHVETVNSLGCINSSSVKIVCVPQPTISANGNLVSTSEGSAYEWYLDGIAIPNSDQQNLTAQNSGIYQALVTNNEGCTSFSDELTVCVPAPTITQIDDNILQASNGTNYQWFVNGDSIDGETSQVIVTPLTGSYTVGVTNNSCTSISQPISIVLGIVELESVINVFPNPTDAILDIEFTELSNHLIHIEIVNFQGITHYEGKVEPLSNRFSINCSHLATGAYFLKIVTDQYAIIEKIVISR